MSSVCYLFFKPYQFESTFFLLLLCIELLSLCFKLDFYLFMSYLFNIFCFLKMEDLVTFFISTILFIAFSSVLSCYINVCFKSCNAKDVLGSKFEFQSLQFCQLYCTSKIGPWKVWKLLVEKGASTFVWIFTKTLRKKLHFLGYWGNTKIGIVQLF